IWKKNPFAVTGRLCRCWLINSRVPAEAARAIVPAPLELVTHGGFAFWNVVICQLCGMRPTGLPAALGIGYWHVAYRLLVRAKLASGGEITGLYFVRSDADQPFVAAVGNLLTDFHFHAAQIRVDEQQDRMRCEVKARGANASFELSRTPPVELVSDSPFASVEEAAAILKYTPVALSPHGPGAVNVVRVARDEQAWRTRLLSIEAAESDFLASFGPVPELAFEVDPLDYRWGRGEIVEVQR
ncbi:MAG TPA: DUF2071 domain-containing protein, partial [Chthoniobacteraceae bacterium]